MLELFLNNEIKYIHIHFTQQNLLNDLDKALDFIKFASGDGLVEICKKELKSYKDMWICCCDKKCLRFTWTKPALEYGIVEIDEFINEAMRPVVVINEEDFMNCFIS